MIEDLEVRNLPSVSLTQGVLFVTGNDQNNAISVEVSNGNVLASDGLGEQKSYSALAVLEIRVRGKDGDDSLNCFLISRNIPTLIVGGDGNDLITGGIGGDRIEAGAGIDTIDGASGNDRLFGGPDDDTFRETSNFIRITATSGSDTFDGGGGNDTVDYSYRLKKLRVSLDGERNDGEIGEEDKLKGDIENIVGGDGNDLLEGSSVKNIIYGNAGKDTIRGLGGGDYLFGEHQNLADGGDSDKLFGGKGDDYLTVDSDHPDTAKAGDGNDTVNADDFDTVVDAETEQ